MATLTEVSAMARRGIKYGTIILIVMALIPGTIGLIKRIYLILNPPPPPPPTVRYGKLPKLIWPEAPNFATPEYKLETISGGLPAFENTGKVYIVGINKSRLLTLERMSNRAQTVGFTNEPVKLDERTYRYVNPEDPIDMIFDVISGAYSYKYDWTRNGEAATSFDVPIGNQAIAEAKGFLQRLGTLPDDVKDGEGKVQYLIASGSTMVPATSAYEANFTRVDLFRAKKEEDLPIVTVGGTTSPINVILSGQSSEKRVVQANYSYSQVLDDDFATYPLKPINEAWEELKSGGGFISRRTPDNSITVRQIYLGYFESNDPQEFLQPVYVFEGDLGFMAYVQAVARDFVNQ